MEGLMPLRMSMVRDVLERAKDGGDEVVIAACRRIIVAHRLGKHGDRADLRLVRSHSRRLRTP